MAVRGRLRSRSATAKATFQLLDRLAEQGHVSIDSVLAELKSPTTITVKPARPGKLLDLPPALVIPQQHLEGHDVVLTGRAGVRARSSWQQAMTACATLRCPHAPDRALVATANWTVLWPLLLGALTDRSRAEDAPGAATVLDALNALLHADRPGLKSWKTRRPLAFAVFDAVAPLVAGMTRCGTDDRCSACLAGRACALDTWTWALAPYALGDLDSVTLRTSFFPPNATTSRAAAWETWRSKGRGRLADDVLWLVCEQWVAVGRRGSAHYIASAAYDRGCFHPQLVNTHLNQVSAGNRPGDLEAALAIADLVLSQADQVGPVEHWRALRARRDWFAGQLDRGTAKPTGEVDEDGNPVLRRRHHPENPKRSRAFRFLRPSP